MQIINRRIQYILVGFAVVLNLGLAGIILLSREISGLPVRANNQLTDYLGLGLWIPVLACLWFPLESLLVFILLTITAITATCMTGPCDLRTPTAAVQGLVFYGASIVLLVLNLVLARSRRRTRCTQDRMDD
jgi:hypothetical protein